MPATWRVGNEVRSLIELPPPSEGSLLTPAEAATITRLVAGRTLGYPSSVLS
jgi:hypothetical protein